MPFADGYVVSAHPPLPLHSKVPRPWALDTYSTVVAWLFDSVMNTHIGMHAYFTYTSISIHV